jgi:hypothetical protein
VRHHSGRHQHTREPGHRRAGDDHLRNRSRTGQVCRARCIHY